MHNTSVIPFTFENKFVRIITLNADLWFVAQDVCEALKIGNTTEAIRKLDDDEKDISLIETLGGNQKMLVINESGLYTLVLRCRDAVKKGTLPHRFRKWGTHEVLPQIRKTGQYLPEKHQPQSPEVFNGNDLNNLARLVWERSDG